MGFVKLITRMYSYDTIKEWHIGESRELQKKIGMGFYNTLFVSRGGVVDFYYDEKECEEFEKALGKYLDEERFNEICDDFMKKINSKEFKIREIVPHLTIFNEVDNYPEWFGEECRERCGRRLMRIRRNTEAKLYEIQERSDIKDFICWRGEEYFSI
jgi:hypothetical protein